MRTVRICPACGRQNPPEETFCENCCTDIASIEPVGISEEASETKQDPAAEQSSHTAPVCQDCGAELEHQPHYPRCRRLNEGFTLVWRDTPLAPVRITQSTPLFIGRVPPVKAELIVYFEEQHQTVSRNHAEIYQGENGNLYLRDMNSMNGSFINGQQVHPFGRILLQPRDVVSFSHSLIAEIN
jgi:hypothetical protein